MMVMKPDAKKTFDCIQMKREIQERIYQDTKDMSVEEKRAYFRRKIQASRFAHLLERADDAVR